MNMTASENPLVNQLRTVPALIVEQASAHPERTAVVCGDRALTFDRLVQQAQDLARRLRAVGVAREDIVACCLPRGLAAVTSVLGVWMASGAYLPLDPAAPRRRTEHMLRDSGARVAVVAAGVDAAVDVAGPAASVRNVISLDTMGALVGDPDSSASSAPSALPYEGDLAYVIYTSGTTGRPKGVLVEHGGLANMAAAHEEVLHPHSAPPSRRVALNAVTTADTFFSDFVNLAAGRTLVVVDDESRRDPERLARFLTDNRIDVFDATPTQLRTLLLGAGTAALESLQVLVIGNEPADADLWRTLRGLPGVRVHNFYGPTECTVDVTSAIVSENEFPVIGKPLAGSEIWLVDSALRPVSDGEAGEICVAGRCLARGYLNAHDDDAARFTQLQIRPDGATIEPGAGRPANSNS
jgi:amino acid adenylation domain-containing protein